MAEEKERNKRREALFLSLPPIPLGEEVVRKNKGERKGKHHKISFFKWPTKLT